MAFGMAWQTCWSQDFVWDLSILVRGGGTLQSSFPNLPEVLEEKGLKKKAGAS